MGRSSHRAQVPMKEVELAFINMQSKLLMRLGQKGEGTFASRHEILGILNEEMHEVTDAVHRGTDQELLEELLDVAVGAIFAVACIRAGLTDW